MHLNHAVTALCVLAALVSTQAFATDTPVEPYPPSRSDAQPVLDDMKVHSGNCLVVVDFTVSVDGKVVDPKITEMYPSTLHRDVYLRAANRERFHPATHEGVAVAAESSAIFTQSQSNPGRITPENQSIFGKVLTTINSSDASPSLDRLREQYEKGTLSLGELGFYFLFQAQIERLNGRYVAGKALADKALTVTPFLSVGTIDAIHAEVILDYAGMDDPAKAVDYFDSWRKEINRDPPSSLANTVEKLRVDHPGTGQAFTIGGYKKTVAKRIP